MEMTLRELATVLAALRYWQSVKVIPAELQGHFADWCRPLDAEEIDDLCERLNGRED